MDELYIYNDKNERIHTIKSIDKISNTKRYAHPDERIKQNVMETYEKLINNGDKTKKEEKENKTKKFFIKRKNANRLANAV